MSAVDSFRFLPRSFRSMYENVVPLDDETSPVWAPFQTRLAEASVALLSSAGLSVAHEQTPFDLENERLNPFWGDPTHRLIPHALGQRPLAMSHLHVNSRDTLADRNVSLPIDVLDDLIGEEVIAGAGPAHISVMGYQEAGLAHWRSQTAPAIVELLKGQETSGLILAPV